MRAILTNLIKAVIVTVFGTVFVYIIVFLLMSRNNPKSHKNLASMINQMVNVRENIQKMQGRSEDVISTINVDNEFQLKENLDDPANRAIYENTVKKEEEEIARKKMEAAAIDNIRLDLTRIQKQLDRLENDNRALTLQVHQLMKPQTGAANSVTK